MREPIVYVARNESGKITAVFATDCRKEAARKVAHFIRSGKTAERVPLDFAREAAFTTLTVEEWRAAKEKPADD